MTNDSVELARPTEKNGKKGNEAEASKNNENKPVLSLLSKLKIVIGIYGFFLLYGISQERIFSLGDENEKFSYGNFLIFCVTFTNMMFSGSCLFFSKERENLNIIKRDKDLLTSMGFVSACSTVAMISTASALTYVNLPTQVLMKSAKSVPVVVGNLLRGKKYPWYDIGTVITVTLMLMLFNFAKPSKGDIGQNSATGYVLLCLSLFMDGLVGPKQDAVVEKYKLGPTELMFIQNLFSSIFAFLLWICIDGFFAPLNFIYRHPESIQWLVIYIITSMGGQHFIYQAIVYFGSLYVSLITTVRKFFTVLLSVLIFGHILNIQQWVGVTGIFLSLILQKVASHLSKKSSSKHN